MQGPGGPSRKRAPARLLRARDPAGDRCLAGLGQKRAGPVRVPLGGHVAVKPQRADANEKRPPGLAWEQTYKHRARDALGLADLRHALPIARTRARGEHTGLRQASMSRGVEARGSSWTPGVPRALGWGGSGKGAKKTGLPGASTKNTGDGACVGEMLAQNSLRYNGLHARERQALPHNLARGRWQNGPDNRPDTAAAPVRDRRPARSGRRRDRDQNHAGARRASHRRCGRLWHLPGDGRRRVGSIARSRLRHVAGKPSDRCEFALGARCHAVPSAQSPAGGACRSGLPARRRNLR